MPSMTKETGYGLFPVDIWVNILLYLSAKDLIKVLSLSRVLQKIGDDCNLWARTFRNRLQPFALLTQPPATFNFWKCACFKLREYKYLQDAIINSSPVSTIYVKPGEYHIQNIEVVENLTIIGEEYSTGDSDKPNQPILKGPCVLFSSYGNSIKLQNLSFHMISDRSDRTGVMRLYSKFIDLENITITGMFPIILGIPTKARISNCYIHDCTSGVYVIDPHNFSSGLPNPQDLSLPQEQLASNFIKGSVFDTDSRGLLERPLEGWYLKWSWDDHLLPLSDWERACIEFNTRKNPEDSAQDSDESFPSLSNADRHQIEITQTRIERCTDFGIIVALPNVTLQLTKTLITDCGHEGLSVTHVGSVLLADDNVIQNCNITGVGFHAPSKAKFIRNEFSNLRYNAISSDSPKTHLLLSENSLLCPGATCFSGYLYNLYLGPENKFIEQKYLSSRCWEAIRSGICTYTKTLEVYEVQPWWSCMTCSYNECEGCCLSCLIRCHHGHQIKARFARPGYPANFTHFFCDCGGPKYRRNCCSQKPLQV
jgi:hypothetical protein